MKEQLLFLIINLSKIAHISYYIKHQMVEVNNKTLEGWTPKADIFMRQANLIPL